MQVSRTLLDYLRPTLACAEIEYLEVDGPNILGLHVSADCLLSFGGCTEGREFRRQANSASIAAAEKLTSAGIDKEKQLLLEDLLFRSSSPSMYNRTVGDLEEIKGSLVRFLDSGMIARYRKYAALFKMSEGVELFLTLFESVATNLKVETGIPSEG